MKKITLVLSVLLGLFSSCSSDNLGNEAPVIPAPVMVKKIIEFYDNGKENKTTSFIYDGNKIVSEVITRKDNSMVGNIGLLYSYKTDYTYTGNLITSISVKNTVRDRLITKTDFLYDSNENLISSVREQSFDSFKVIMKIVYSKSDTNNIICKMYSSDSRDNIETLFWEGRFTFDANENLIKSESLDSSSLYTTFEYDTKPNPKNTILGLNKIIFQEYAPNYNVSFLQYHLNRSNNVLKYEVYGERLSFSYSYNANGYPTEAKVYNNYNGNSILDKSFQYFYE